MNGRVIDVSSYIIDVNSCVIDVNGRVIDVNSCVIDVNSCVIDVNGRVIDVNSCVIDVNSRAIDIKIGLEKKTAQLELQVKTLKEALQPMGEEVDLPAEKICVCICGSLARD